MSLNIDSNNHQDNQNAPAGSTLMIVKAHTNYTFIFIIEMLCGTFLTIGSIFSKQFIYFLIGLSGSALFFLYWLKTRTYILTLEKGKISEKYGKVKRSIDFQSLEYLDRSFFLSGYCHIIFGLVQLNGEKKEFITSICPEFFPIKTWVKTNYPDAECIKDLLSYSSFTKYLDLDTLYQNINDTDLNREKNKIPRKITYIIQKISPFIILPLILIYGLNNLIHFLK